MKSIVTKIAGWIVVWSIILIAVIGTVSMKNSSDVIKKEAKEKLLAMAKREAVEFERLTFEAENGVEHLSTSTIASFDIKKAKDTAYMDNYQANIDAIVKKFGETSKGTMGIYIYFNPELTGKVYGVWYTDEKGDGKFNAHELESIENFKPDNEDMAFYYKPVKAKKALWMEPYIDPNLKIKMTSYVKPIYIDNTLVAVVGMDINFNKFSDKIASIKAYNTGKAFLLDDKYNFLYHWKYKQEDNLKNVEGGALKELADSIAQKDSDVVQLKSGKNTDIAAYSKISNGEIVCISAPENEILAGLQKLKNTLNLMLACTIVITIFMGAAIGIFIARPIKKLTKVINKTARLQLDRDEDIEKLVLFNDEIGTMASSIKEMRSSLISMVKELKNAALETGDNCKSVLSISTSLKGSAGETSEETSLISIAMQHTAASAEEINASTFEIGLAVNSIAEKAVEGANISYSISERAKQLKEDSTILAENASRVYDEVKQDMENAIDKSSAVLEINKLTDSILQITKQTKLLALNASIEASRAGENGKGFAVVADAIKVLAEESSQTVSDIQGVVNEVISSVDNLSTSSKKILEFMDINVQKNYSNLIGTAEQYYDDSQTFNGLMQELSSTVEEVNSSIETIAQTIEELNAAITNSVEGVQHISERTQLNLNEIQEVEYNAIDSENSVSLLNGIVERFKVND